MFVSLIVEEGSSIEYQRLFIIASVLALGSFYISFSHLSMFWDKYPFSSRSSAASAVILVVPIITSLQLLSMLFFTLYTTFDLIRIIYESFALYIFFELMIEMLGGFMKTVQLLEESNPSAWYAVFPLCFLPSLGFPKIRFTKEHLGWVRLGALQICVVRPIAGLLVVLMKAAGVYETTDAYRTVSPAFFIMMSDMFTFFLTFYCLLILYFACHKLLHFHNLEFKFIALKSVFFLSVCQIYILDAMRKSGLITGTSFYSAEHRVIVFNSCIFCAESIGLALLFRAAYPISLMKDIHEFPEGQPLKSTDFYIWAD